MTNITVDEAVWLSENNELPDDHCHYCDYANGVHECECGFELTEKECLLNQGKCDTCSWLIDK